jgi:hypothetical protein
MAADVLTVAMNAATSRNAKARAYTDRCAMR